MAPLTGWALPHSPAGGSQDLPCTLARSSDEPSLLKATCACVHTHTHTETHFLCPCSGTKRKGFFATMYASLGCGALSAKCTAGWVFFFLGRDTGFHTRQHALARCAFSPVMKNKEAQDEHPTSPLELALANSLPLGICSCNCRALLGSELAFKESPFLDAQIPTQSPAKNKKGPRLHELVRKVRADFSLLSFDTIQEPNGNCADKLVEMNFFILGGFLGVDFPPVTFGIPEQWGGAEHKRFLT